MAFSMEDVEAGLATPATSVSERAQPTGEAASERGGWWRGWRRPQLAVMGLVAAAAGLAFVVARDGTPVWRLPRLLAVVALAVVARTALTPARPALRSVTALVSGCVAIPVGVGVAGPHLVKTGAGLMSVAGVSVLAGGVILLASGARGLLRLTPRWWRIPEVGVIVIACFVLTWSLGHAVAATNVPRPHLGSRTPADVGLAYRDVTFPAADEVALSGWYVPSRTGAAVALLHGAGSTRSNVLDHAAVLARYGFGVLLYDARGHGRSDGRAMDFGWYGDDDLQGAVAFLETQPDVDATRIAAVGMSMGGEQAIGAAADIEAIRAVVAEGATNRVAGDKDWLSDEFGLRGALTEGVDRLTYGFADLLTSASPPITLHDAVRSAAPRPVLLIAAGDIPDEPRAARFIRDSSPDTVEVWVAPNSSHTDALRNHPEEWETRVVAFLDNALAPNASGSRP